MPDLSKCFCLPSLLATAFSTAAFVIAYVLYRILLFIFRKLTHQKGLGGLLVQELRYPVLIIFLEIAALLSLEFLKQPEETSHLIRRFINLLLIAAIGWFALGITRAFYHNYVDKIGEDIIADSSRRSFLTQLLFLYRLIVFSILAVTAGAILLTFPYIRSVGVGILGSAGIVGIALGIAARPILLNLIAGFQIAMTKMINIGDAIHLEGEFARIEAIHLTHVVVCTWDWRRIIIPISYFIDKPFQNWDATRSELLASILLYCDYTVPVEAIRKKAGDLISSHPNWNKKTWNVQVTNCTEQTVEIRVAASANDASSAFTLRAFLREKLIDFLQSTFPEALPKVRSVQVIEKKQN